MKRILCLTMAVVLAACAGTAALATETSGADYTVAGKLLKQLAVGSGFGGTLEVEIAAGESAQGGELTTQKPLAFNWSYIYVRDDGLNEKEHRLDLALMDGEAVQTALHAQWKGGVLSFQADAAGEDWFSLTPSAATATAVGTQGGADADTVSGLIGAGMQSAYAYTGMPSFLSAYLPALLSVVNADSGLEEVLESYLTRMDLWIEGYRQSAELGKMADGTGTMEARYVITPTNIKAQLKQMLLSLLANPSAVARLTELLGAELSAGLLKPEWQAYYFEAIDALPLSGDLTITRMVSLKGDTLALHLSLPFYDATGGNVTLRYDRTRGEGDLPDENTFSLESGSRAMQLAFWEYSSMTDVSVTRGTFYNEALDSSSFAVSDEGSAPEPQKPVAVAFTLRKQQTEGRDDQARDTYACTYQLSLTQDPEYAGQDIMAFEDLELTLDTSFASKTQKTASTEMNAKLVIAGEKRPQTFTVTLNGKTRKLWTPAETPTEKRAVGEMTRAEAQALLTAAGVKAAAVLLPYLNLPKQ